MERRPAANEFPREKRLNPQPKIYVAGHQGMVGSAIVRQLQSATIITRSLAELDLTNQAAVRAFFESEKPDQVYLNWSPKNGRHEVCKFDFLEGL